MEARVNEKLEQIQTWMKDPADPDIYDLRVKMRCLSFADHCDRILVQNAQAETLREVKIREIEDEPVLEF